MNNIRGIDTRFYPQDVKMWSANNEAYSDYQDITEQQNISGEYLHAENVLDNVASTQISNTRFHQRFHTEKVRTH